MKTFKLYINYSQPPVDLGCLSMYFFYSFLGLGGWGREEGVYYTQVCTIYRRLCCIWHYNNNLKTCLNVKQFLTNINNIYYTAHKYPDTFPGKKNTEKNGLCHTVYHVICVLKNSRKSTVLNATV